MHKRCDAVGTQKAAATAHTPSAVNAEDLRTAVDVVRQCAWCWLVMDGAGQYRIPARAKITSATHGICPCCKEVVRAEIEGRTRSPRLTASPALAVIAA